jgi:hypothetical protein
MEVVLHPILEAATRKRVGQTPDNMPIRNKGRQYRRLDGCRRKVALNQQAEGELRETKAEYLILALEHLLDLQL